MVPHRIAVASLTCAALSCSFAIRAQETPKPDASEMDKQIRVWIVQLGVVKDWPEAARRLESTGERAVESLLDAIGRDGSRGHASHPASPRPAGPHGT